MNLSDVLKTVGSAVVRNTVPGGGILVDVVNAALPAAMRLAADATGQEIEATIKTLPADKQAEILSREFDVQIEHIKQGNESIRAAIRADANDPHTTRPYIAKQAFHVVAFVIVTVMLLWSYAVFASKHGMVLQITEGWPFVLAILGPLVTLLWAYFGVLREEHKSKMNASNGMSSLGVLGTIAGLIKK